MNVDTQLSRDGLYSSLRTRYKVYISMHAFAIWHRFISFLAIYLWPCIMGSVNLNLQDRENEYFFDSIQYIIYTSELLVGDHELQRSHHEEQPSLVYPSSSFSSTSKFWRYFAYLLSLQIVIDFVLYKLSSAMASLHYLKFVKIIALSYICFSSLIRICHCWTYFIRIMGLSSLNKFVNLLHDFETTSNRVYSQICELEANSAANRSRLMDFLPANDPLLFNLTEQNTLSYELSGLYEKLLPRYQLVLSRIYPYAAASNLRNLLSLYRLPNCFGKLNSFDLRKGSSTSLKRSSMYLARKENQDFDDQSTQILNHIKTAYYELTIISKQVLCCILSFPVDSFLAERSSWLIVHREVGDLSNALSVSMVRLVDILKFSVESVNRNQHNTTSKPFPRIMCKENLRNLFNELHSVMMETHESISSYIQEGDNTAMQTYAMDEYDQVGLLLKDLLSEWDFNRALLLNLQHMHRKRK
ncbi:Myosin binding vezatin family protein [Schizosaccharomyces pombe]